jgi:acyl-CoA synthetase (NDP forming)
MRLLSRYGIRTLGRVASLDEILSMPRPIVLKADTEEHKTDKGLLFVGLKTDAEIEEAYKSLSPRYTVFAQPIVKGIEFMIGAVNDPTFEKVVSFGAGGTMAEIFRDVNFRAVPVSKKDAEDMVEGLKISRVFQGFRGINPKKADVVELLVNFSRLCSEISFKELDINPVIANDKGAFAVDARVIV